MTNECGQCCGSAHVHMCCGTSKSALCAHILHEFVVLLEAKPSAKPQTSLSAIYGA